MGNKHPFGKFSILIISAIKRGSSSKICKGKSFDVPHAVIQLDFCIMHVNSFTEVKFV